MWLLTYDDQQFLVERAYRDGQPRITISTTPTSRISTIIRRHIAYDVDEGRFVVSGGGNQFHDTLAAAINDACISIQALIDSHHRGTRRLILSNAEKQQRASHAGQSITDFLASLPTASDPRYC